MLEDFGMMEKMTKIMMMMMMMMMQAMFDGGGEDGGDDHCDYNSIGSGM